MNSATNAQPRPPSRRTFWKESRALVDLATMPGPLLAAGLRKREGPSPMRVVTVPGFGADDWSMLPLRRFLKSRGFQSEGWGLGRNLGGLDLKHELSDLSERWDFIPRDNYQGEGGVPYLCDRLFERLVEQYGDSDQPIALVGWSLGGFLAREAARDLPDLVDRVITLGSPIVGGPKYTATAERFRSLGQDLDWIEDEIARRESKPIQQPITCIYSKSDAIVDWRAAIDRYSSDVNHIEVNVAHLGFAFNSRVWRHVEDALRA
ncbi:MAG: alpha/beta hydrolase [Pseudomonadota bacterium]